MQSPSFTRNRIPSSNDTEIDTEIESESDRYMPYVQASSSSSS